jgi:hypothetical protein
MHLETVYRFRTILEQRFSHLSRRQAVGLSVACLGLITAQHCRLSAIAEALPEVGRAETVKQRVKRWLKNDRLDLDRLCEAWMRWVWAAWNGPRPVLLVDETKLGDRLGVMMVSVAYAKRAIPLIWRCYRANDADAYPRQGQVLLVYGLLAKVLSTLPDEMRPLVQLDRGLAHSSAMLRALNALKVDYLVRVKQTARFTTHAGKSQLLTQVVQRGQQGCLHGTLFGRDHAVKGSLYWVWEAGQAQAWCLFTNVPTVCGRQYALRWWQEESFKDLKSGGWQWQASHLRCPKRMERLLLVMALAYGWMLCLGQHWRALPPEQQSPVSPRDGGHRFSLFRLGLRWYRYLLHHAPDQLRVALVFVPPHLSGFD